MKSKGLSQRETGKDHHPGRSEESPELDNCQGPLLPHLRQDIAGGGVPQAGSKEESLAEERGGKNAGGEELFLAC